MRNELTLTVAALLAVNCARYEPAPGYEELAKRPAPVECFPRIAWVTLDTLDVPSSDSVAVHVADEHGRPVANASVRIQGEAGTWAALSSSEGITYVSVKRLRTGALDIRAVGYNTFSFAGDSLALRARRLDVVLPRLIFDGPCSAVVVQKKPWWKFW